MEDYLLFPPLTPLNIGLGVVVADQAQARAWETSGGARSNWEGWSARIKALRKTNRRTSSATLGLAGWTEPCRAAPA